MTSGIGAALLVPASLALLRMVWTEPHERAHAIGIFAGMAFNTGPLLNVAISAVAPARVGTASALVNSGRMLGATLGVAALGSVYAVQADVAHGFSLAMMTGAGVACLRVKTPASIAPPGQVRSVGRFR